MNIERIVLFGNRCLALYIDFLLVLLLRYALRVAGVGNFRIYIPIMDKNTPGGFLFYAMSYFTSGLPEIITAAIWACYSFAMLATFRQTLGMMICNLKLVCPRGISQVLTRQLLSLLSSMTFGIGYLLAVFTPKCTALHDLLSGSYVILENNELK